MQYRLFIDADKVSGEVEKNLVTDLLDGQSAIYFTSEAEKHVLGEVTEVLILDVFFMSQEQMEATVMSLEDALQNTIGVQLANEISYN